MGQKVLIVDDQYGIRLLLYEVFKREGYEVHQAENGKKALEMVKRHTPDIILLDMKLPGMDGIEILKQIRKIDDNVKVIMMTAYGELDMLAEAVKYNVVTYFTKPFDIDQLKNKVNEVLTTKGLTV